MKNEWSMDKTLVGRGKSEGGSWKVNKKGHFYKKRGGLG